MSNRIVFLDVNGVLNNNSTLNTTPEGYIGIEDHYISRLRAIIDAAKAKIILVSDWKDGWNTDPKQCRMDCHYLNCRLGEHRIFITDKTDDSSRGKDEKSGRGLGIRKYLEEHPTDSYVILDDVLFDDYDEELQEHLILVSNGLSFEDMKRATDMLKT